MATLRIWLHTIDPGPCLRLSAPNGPLTLDELVSLSTPAGKKGSQLTKKEAGVRILRHHRIRPPDLSLSAPRQALTAAFLNFSAGYRCFFSSHLIMASSSGTMRGTPNRNQGRSAMPAFNNSPASNIPRPPLEPHGSSAISNINLSSDAGSSTMSSSRQKQSKRDEVCQAVVIKVPY